jgi:hypothetical protein
MRGRGGKATVIGVGGQICGLVEDGEIASTVYSRITKEAKSMRKDVSHGIRLIYAGNEIENNGDPIELLSKEELAALPGFHKGPHDKIAMTIKLSGGGGRLRRRKRKSKRKSRRKSKSRRRRRRSR